MLVDGFVKGVPDTMQTLVSCSNPATLPAAVTAARKLELLPRQNATQNSLSIASLLSPATLDTELSRKAIATILGPTVLTGAEQINEALKTKNAELQE